MTVPLSPGSPRAIAARRFGDELRKAMTTRGVSVKRLAESTGVAPSALNSWRSASNVPRPATAARLAEALDWPKLTVIATEARTSNCARCGRRFVNDGGAAKMYCSTDCREVDAQLRKPSAGAVLHDAVRAATDARLSNAPERETLRATLDALHAYERSHARHRTRVDMAARQSAALQAAIDGMCAGCEPEGLCRTAECPLRAFSPLPMASGRTVTAVRRASSPHAPEHRERWLAAIRAANEERWSREGERERASERSRAYWEGMTPEDRKAAGAAISSGRRLA